MNVYLDIYLNKGQTRHLIINIIHFLKGFENEKLYF